ncbi:hypothetical protein [uncultured Gelidibacter sp.]|uniref:hypothetical protein n=1 Tax=uncultured Gelidibacter sp. TaxID=259318 RepID=UPI00262DBE1F|nr:hypothetical protein [uncultured Gelidibacter sp.]
MPLVILLIITWIVAVLCMTFFSAIWSAVSGNEFREPTLLSILMQKHPRIHVSEQSAYVWGWVIHFLFGVAFLLFYQLLWKFTNAPRTLVWSVIFGSVLGVLGILGWKILFSIVNFSSQFKYQQYYVHIFLAHIVFSVTAFVVYQWLT